MFDITKSSLRFLAVLGLAGALTGAFVKPASAEEEAFDLIINTDGTGVSIAPQEPDIPTSALFNRRMIPNPGFPDFPGAPFAPAPYVDDTGFDAFPGLDFDSGSGVPYDADGNGTADYPFVQATIQQVGISGAL
jgi:hypothetical protein